MSASPGDLSLLGPNNHGPHGLGNGYPHSGIKVSFSRMQALLSEVLYVAADQMLGKLTFDRQLQVSGRVFTPFF